MELLCRFFLLIVGEGKKAAEMRRVEATSGQTHWHDNGHTTTVNRETPLPPEALFRALGDSTRLRSLLLLLREGELCVCELTVALDLSQPKISRHLAHLREGGIASVRRDGTWVFYRVNERLPDWARQVLQRTLEGCAQEERFRADCARLEQMPNRPSRQAST